MPLMLGNLETLVQDGNVPDKGTLSEIVLRQMLLALDCIASHDIIHSDIIPENILWESDDAGEYRFRLSGFSPSGTSMIARNVTGTEPFMAPEVFHRQQHTTKVDIWSLFAVIVWIRDAEFRRRCHLLSEFHIHEWLISFSQLDQYVNIRGMANINPRKRPSAKKQLAILDGSDFPDLWGPGEDELGDDPSAGVYKPPITWLGEHVPQYISVSPFIRLSIAPRRLTDNCSSPTICPIPWRPRRVLG